MKTLLSLRALNLTLLLAYTAAIAGATWTIVSYTYEDRLTAAYERAEDYLRDFERLESNVRQFVELWENELEKGIEENVGLVRSHYDVMKKHIAVTNRLLGFEPEIVRLGQEVLNGQQASIEKYENLLESFRTTRRRWQQLKPTK